MNVLSPFLSHRARRPQTIVDTVVMHATAGSSLSGAISTLRSNGFSYHYIIEKSGEITKCVPYLGVAYHAGSSYGPHEEARGISREQDPKTQKFKAGTSVNEYSLGICMVNRNNANDPYSQAQMDSAAGLIAELIGVFPHLKHLTTHYWVSPHRKFDPDIYDMKELASRVSLSLWQFPGWDASWLKR